MKKKVVIKKKAQDGGTFKKVTLSKNSSGPFDKKAVTIKAQKNGGKMGKCSHGCN